jgi:hypothetical protein
MLESIQILYRFYTVAIQIEPLGNVRCEIKMDVLIRNLDPTAIKKIDELAKKQNVKRNTFLQNLIQNFAALEEFKNYEERYQTTLDKCLRVIQKNTDTLQEVLNIVGDDR